MSKPLYKASFPTEHNKMVNEVKTLQRSFVLDSGSLKEINTAGLSNSEIDELLVEGEGKTVATPPNGTMISDPTNKLILIRQVGIWRKVSVT